ncbi:MAG TPA: NUDIX hydrolase, partial [Candidatus Methanoperedenaceae archaeon]|nr:NUDIX hydrolase [Candidatus Methanoperedenaceae archaeon]
MGIQKTPLLTVDVVILCEGSILLIRRRNPPFQGMLALPGGFVEIGETTEQAAAREALEEAGMDIRITGLVGVYSDPARDPRRHTVSVCYLARGMGTPAAGSDAKSVELFNIERVPDLAF